MRHLPNKNQVWVIDGKSGNVWCYHYAIGNGAWTNLRFHGTVSTVSAVQDKVYLGIGNTLYRVNDARPDDPGVDIDALIRAKTLIKTNQVLLKGVMMKFDPSVTSKIHINVEGFDLSIASEYWGDIAYLDEDIAYFDGDVLVDPLVNTIRRRCNIRRWSFTPEIIVTNGQFSLSSFWLEVAEV
jgi:hypothetical protein